ncbi:mCG54937, isoform CRA_e [Mus musculus]|nr:mCG54937, isoform CRA_e [Mus musculus]
MGPPRAAGSWPTPAVPSSTMVSACWREVGGVRRGWFRGEDSNDDFW